MQERRVLYQLEDVWVKATHYIPDEYDSWDYVVLDGDTECYYLPRVAQMKPLDPLEELSEIT